MGTIEVTRTISLSIFPIMIFFTWVVFMYIIIKITNKYVNNKKEVRK